MSALQAERREAAQAPDALEVGLTLAARAPSLAFLAVPAPVAPIARFLAAVPRLSDEGGPVVAWTSPDGLAIAGCGAARELRGTGDARWQDVIAAAGPLPEAFAVVDGRPAPLAALGDARPRFLGGAAFAPGSADGAPWTGFGDAWFVLPRIAYVSDGARAQLVLALDAREAAQPARWRTDVATLLAALAADDPPRAQPALLDLRRAAAIAWHAQITDITRAIDAGTVAKVVAARTATVTLAGPVRHAALLGALDDRHADCVRVLLQPRGAGALVAASPERLVRRDGALVECDALAGTHAIGAGERPEDRNDAIAEASAALLGSAKERWEHDLVVTAIRAALEDAGADLRTVPTAPAIRALRHVVHLHTPFRAQLREPRHVLELVARLHPTPAVGGTPHAEAIEWIRTREPVARGWYASPVGWFDLDGNGDFAVAIRSGVLAGNRAHLWAGGGIVAGSDPDREYAETEQKLRAILGALGVAA